MAPVARALSAARRAAHDPWSRCGWFAACALFVTLPLFDSAGQLIEFRDAQLLQSYEMVAVKSVLEHLEWPLWNPYTCGGMYALGTPQSRFAAPPFLLSLLFGALGATAITAFAMCMLGMEGFFRYARERAGSALGPALVAPVFAAHGTLSWGFYHGWVNFYGLLLLPWILYGVHLAGRGRAGGVPVVAASFGFVIGFGGTYAAPLGALLAIVEALRTLLEERPRGRRLGRALGWLALAAFAALLASAFRLWPVVESLIAAPRIMAGAPEQPLKNLAVMAFEPGAPANHNMTRAGQMFVGLAFLPLAAFGLFRLRALVPFALGLVSLWLATGYAADPSLFALLRELPVYATLRYPQRFVFVASLFAAEMGALGVSGLTRLARARTWLAPLLLVALGIAGYNLYEQHAHAASTAAGMWLSPPPQGIEQPFRQARGNRWMMAHYPAIERGSIACWEAYPVPMSRLLRGDLAADEYLADARAGKVVRKHFSPNRLVLELELDKPARVLVNQNYHPGWKSSLGRVVSHEGLLAVDAPAGKRELVLHFWPRSFVFGVPVSLLGMFAALALAAGQRRRALYAFAAAPLLFASSFLLSSEPLPAAPRPTNADGSPAVVERLPASATKVHAEFALPVTLEGAVAPEKPDATGHGRFALFFRVHGPVPRTVGVSVHFESSTGRVKRADHEVIAASVFLADAPRGALLRDVASVSLGSKPGETWKMYVSLWHASGDKSRVAVRRASSEVRKDRVLVLEFPTEIPR
jgi:hypothetical protein